MQLKNLRTKFLGRNLTYYKEIDSTQNEIWRLIENEDIENGQLVMADIQTKGKGTHGRTWYTDEVSNIAFSFFIKLDCSVEKLEGVTIEIAEIIIEIFKSKYGITLKIKKPNDIVYKNKKIGGILSETKVISGKAKCLVIGIGINTSKEHFTDDIKDIATSIKREFGIEVDIKEFIAEFCNKFESEIIRRSEN